jgi:Glu-tRNA(Gln) amidotransferase subunit E-like FAD-binding protein
MTVADEMNDGYCKPCAYYTEDSADVTCIDRMMIAAADALEATEKQIARLEEDLLNGTISNIDRFKIYGYTVKDLILFADMCKRNDVCEEDLKQAAWNLELAVRAVMNERAEIVKNTMDEISMRFTPDFEKAYEEMRGEHDD